MLKNVSILITVILTYFPLSAQDFSKTLYFSLNQDGVVLDGDVTVTGRFIFNGGPYLRLEYKNLTFTTVKYKDFSSSDVYSEYYKAVAPHLQLPFVVNTGGYFVEVEASAKIPKEFVGTLSSANAQYVAQSIKVYPISDVTLIKEANDYFKTVNSDNFSDNDFWVKSKINQVQVTSISSNITRIIKQKIEKGLADLHQQRELASREAEREKATLQKEEIAMKTTPVTSSTSSSQVPKSNKKTVSKEVVVTEEKKQNEEKSKEEEDEWEASGKILKSYRKPKPKILYNSNNRSQNNIKVRQEQANNIYNQAINNSNQAQKNLDNWNNTWENVQNSITAQAERERAERERKAREYERQRLIEERQRKAKKEQERIRRAEQQRIQNRQKEFWNTVNDIAMPLTYSKAKCYALVVSKTSLEKAVFIPVLIHKKSNDKMPYKQDLLRDIQTERNVNYMSLHSLYDDAELLKKEMIRLSDIGYENYVDLKELDRFTHGKPYEKTTTTNTNDFWNN